uniref:Hd repeat domain-containing protein n=1 Tax=Hirondellea gigas TaxID=1518452 RepID=A0A6A7GDU3_9CRUS
MTLVEKTESFVRAELKGNDLSHDFDHILRVRNLALKIAKEESFEGDDLQIIELAALLHDVKDWKYSKSETAGVEAVQEFLLEQKVSHEVISRILRIVDGVSFKNELGSNSSDSSHLNLREVYVVRDADRLDAIGAIGIARTFAYSGFKGLPLMRKGDESLKVHTLSKEEYMNRDVSQQSTIRHFYEKLLRVESLMKTKTGKRIAARRHQFMEEYLLQFFGEIRCEF